jgi:sulfate/thiosulfate transport system ATP-binding protein
MSIEVRNVSKTFGTFEALKNVNLTVAQGELVALLGPSGSGKTTLLRIIAGLDFPDSGAVLLSGEDATQRTAGQRQVGFVFQHYALFRHMTVFQNVAFGMTVRPRKIRASKAEIHARVMELLKLVQLDWLADRYPAQLSGGQRQRIALARSLAVQPKVLLLDEPFGALDARVRRELRLWLRRLHDEIQLTCVFVTHDQDEALEVSDRVAVLNEGNVEQIGTPEEVYDHPANPFVYNFLGNVNLFHGRVGAGKAHLGDIEIDAPEHIESTDEAVVGFARPHDMEIERRKNGNEAMEAIIAHIQSIGSVVRIKLNRMNGTEKVEVEMTKERYRELDLLVGECVFVRPRQLRFFLKSATKEESKADHPLDFTI